MTGKRKYSLFIITLIVTAVLCWLRSINGEEFSGVIKLCFAGFILGNGAERFLDGRKNQ